MGKRLVALFMALSIPVSSFANINLDGAILEMSAPETVRGREMTTIHGGGIRFRIRDETFRPFSVVPPSVRGGCGGIDATFGAFSYFNMDYLGQFLQNLLQGLPVVFFNLALHTFCPQCQQLFQQLTSLANQINQIGVSKCGAIAMATELGRHLIDSALDKENRRDDRSNYAYGGRDAKEFFNGLITQLERYTEKLSDALSRYCPGGNCLMGILLNVRKQPTSLMRMMVKNGDIPPGVSIALGVSGSQLEGVLRAIFGDVALFPPEKDDKNNIKGYYVQVHPGLNGADVMRMIIGDSCLPSEVNYLDVVNFTGDRGGPFTSGGTVAIYTLCGKIATYTQAIKNKIINRQALSDEEVRLLASLPAPVLYLINAGSIEPGLLDAVFQNIDRYMASELLFTVLNKAREKYGMYLTACVSDAKDKVDASTREQCKIALDNLGEKNRTLFEVRMHYYKELANSLQAAEVAYGIHSRIMAQMAGTPLYGTLMFTRMLSTAGGGR